METWLDDEEYKAAEDRGDVFSTKQTEDDIGTTEVSSALNPNVSLANVTKSPRLSSPAKRCCGHLLLLQRRL